MDADELLDLLDGTIPDFGKEHGYVRCDICFSRIKPHTTVGIYATNIDISKRSRQPLRANMIFCSTCNPERIRVPMIGVSEVQFSADIVDEGGLPRMENPVINQTETTASGIAWQPTELWTEIMPTDPPSMNDGATTPMHITEVLFQSGVPVEEIIQDDGSLDFEGYSRSELEDSVKSYLTDVLGDDAQ